MNVLIVEDDRALALFLHKQLLAEGHEVVWAADGDEALEQATLRTPDLVVLDLGLPRRDGTEVLKAIHENFRSTSVLVLTARGQVEERVRCLDLGADDFLLKPFSFHELMARCRALMRRREKFVDPVLRFGGVQMNRMNRTVVYEGTPVELTAKEFRLLEFFMQRKGVCSTRNELLKQVWDAAEHNGTNIVDVYVTYLRRKLEAARPEDLVEGSVIETVRGSGYRLRERQSDRCATVAQISTLSSARPAAVPKSI